jgi:hypothetical protein
MTPDRPNKWRPPPRLSRAALLATGRKISDELIAYAAAAMRRLEAIDRGQGGGGADP